MEWLSDWSTWWKILGGLVTALGVGFPSPKRSVMVKSGRFLLSLRDATSTIAGLKMDNRQKDQHIETLEGIVKSWERDYNLLVAATESANARTSSIVSMLESVISSPENLPTTSPTMAVPEMIPTIPADVESVPPQS